jgi:hypothetical protein
MSVEVSIFTTQILSSKDILIILNIIFILKKLTLALSIYLLYNYFIDLNNKFYFPKTRRFKWTA